MSESLFEAIPCTKCGRKLRIGTSERGRKQVTCAGCNTTHMLDNLLKKDKEVMRKMRSAFRNIKNIRIKL